MSIRARAGIILRDYKGKSWFLLKSKTDAMRGPLSEKQASAVIFMYRKEMLAAKNGEVFKEWPFGQPPLRNKK